jgi:hypothetical protein
VLQDQGRSTIAMMAADRMLGWSEKNPLRRVFCFLLFGFAWRLVVIFLGGVTVPAKQ